MNHYSISGYTIDLSNLPEYMTWDKLEQFASGLAEPQIVVSTMSGSFEDIYKIPDGAERLMSDPIHTTFKYGGFTHFFHTPDDVVSYVKVNDDYSEYIINIEPGYFDGHPDPDSLELIRDVVMQDIRKMLTGRLALDKGLCIHSCVINYEGEGILFSAVTKTGKSTQAHLWQEMFPGTEIINGDNGFCRVLDGCPFVFGAPWCGDSNEYMNKTLPVRAIVFIERASENSIEKLSALEAFMRLSARCYMPFWDKALVNKTMDTVEYMTQKVACYLLRCQPDRDAVRIAHHELFGT